MNDDTLKQENPELYRIAREGGTEPAFQGKYVDTKEDGAYYCAVCSTKLFSSETKFDSGSGWPSFTDPVVLNAVILKTDKSHGMKRTEVTCAHCGAHLGHVFPDGPMKNGNVCDRYCINSISLDFRKND
jgi:peptide-methionine (R)-S-oxide reductase